MAARIPIALQLYTVREEAARDLAGTLAKVAEIGYSGVELGGFPGTDAAEVRRMLDDNGLAPVGTHVAIDVLEKSLPDVIAYNQTLGTPYVTCPYLGDDRRGDIAAYRATGRLLNDIGAKLKAEGLTFAYHHHAFEFEAKEDGVYGLDALLEAADPENLGLELDTYWVAKGGEDPVAYLQKYRGRVRLVHVKDMAGPEADGRFAEVGEGVLDWPAIFEAAESGSVAHYIVEQDRCFDRTPLESIALSLDNLRKMGKV
jgi:Sugar phosphate isomerases/epimerases